ncbi:unnamed protein product [Arctogadus glacialis]
MALEETPARHKAHSMDWFREREALKAQLLGLMKELEENRQVAQQLSFNVAFSGFNTQGCQEPAGCNMTSSSTLLGATVNTTVTCCDSDKCNPATISSGVSTARLSLVAVFASALMVSGWSTL